MTQEKWVVEIEGTKYHIWATDMSDAIEQAVNLGAIKVYKFHQNELQNDQVSKTYPSCIDPEVIKALTDTQLFEAITRINKELDYRQTDFLTIPNFCGRMKED